MGNDTQRFRMTKLRRTANAVVAGFIRYGIGPSELHLLTTRGSKSGFLRTTPVSLQEDDRGRFLVAPYGEVGWVRNIRKDGFATLRHGGWIEMISVREVAPERAAPVLREYLRHPRAAIVGRYFDTTPDEPVEAFAKETPTHPVFEIVRSTTIRL
ncbi:deazaflavin-dependent oxidoreductase (nitroreductase family) [Lipingzhangella halophila]|uniref:Deazaflavin-dependent oxidoreductase (Nitroreductase family) n=1 Tax=Lipingzhangella halophila TaxID=1783352 RepID=A0A7W7W2P1_9ACTN|nr:nitroreductase/quinone reductase family protein [Lipingzhangella halophila]MBB4930885.1 deazaflavin-dependent oxidoreductase (nitroreductase family) [Lipingzhangella halophila]